MCFSFCHFDLSVGWGGLLVGGEGWEIAVRALYCSANTELRHEEWEVGSGKWEVERGFPFRKRDMANVGRWV